MPVLNIRLTASESVANTLINEIGALEGVDSAEEVADLMPHMDDDDSSSAGLTDDIGPGYHAIIVETSNETISNRVREVAEAVATEAGAALEFVDDF
jgi:hypothetical protein